ncbi:tagaturonate epimerase family protein [Aquibacillus kalidii]|uniref:tagaturonate epimerase family protein n=1 Tax=Aquibacillus kalidii TaxID=2762597 RepID=UPI002E28B2FF|nr:tagaturonate epimerase family protein [Aquibacillus kalidii]
MLKPVWSALQQGIEVESDSNVKVYEKSLTIFDNTKLVIVKAEGRKVLLAIGGGNLFNELFGETVSGFGKICPLNHENRLVLNRYFDYTVPQAFGTDVATIGLGDRLGLASPGHIETVRSRNVKPILAQQSIRELTLTNRTMTDILDATAFAVFQEGYKDGYGADGDHIKKEKDIRYALSLGISFLTLDCSDKIRNDMEAATNEEIRVAFEQLPTEIKEYYKSYYLEQVFRVNDLAIVYNEHTLMKNTLLYREALQYMEHVYNTYIANAEKAVDFEISIDETETVTSPEAHYFVANELKRRGVSVTSLAPRFCGEFQKGIDYIGDLEQFEKELSEHARIAESFGYKLSIHSGSDKFSVFPIIGKYTKGVLHVKTAGTNWLEAVRVIAETNPDLYRNMHKYATEHLEEALRYYHITADFASITPLDNTPDEQLSNYMDEDAARQLIHITYGILLTAKDENGEYLFKDEFYKTLVEHEETYRASLVKHIGKHLDLLGV